MTPGVLIVTAFTSRTPDRNIPRLPPRPPTPAGGGGGGGGGGKKKKPAAQTLSGTVVRVNPIAQSYTLSTGGLIAIHADTLPQVGDKLEVPVRRLANSTYAENGSRNQTGTADSVSFSGTVTYCGDLEQPAAACDGSSSTDHYVYVVSGLGRPCWSARRTRRRALRPRSDRR